MVAMGVLGIIEIWHTALWIASPGTSRLSGSTRCSLNHQDASLLSLIILQNVLGKG